MYKVSLFSLFTYFSDSVVANFATSLSIIIIIIMLVILHPCFQVFMKWINNNYFYGQVHKMYTFFPLLQCF